MTGPKRTKLEIKRDRAKITELYIQGHYQSDIAEQLGLTQPQISYDLKVIQKEWVKNTTLSLDEYKGKELAKIDHLECVYWQAWDRSLRDFKSKIIKGKGIGKDKETGKPIADSTEQTMKTEDRNGDPRYLDGVMKCIEQRCKLLGIYAPEKREHTGKDGGPIVINDQREAILERLKNNPELKEKLKNAIRD